MKKTLIIMSHPDSNTFSERMAHAYSEGALEAGAEVKTLCLKDLNFDPILHFGYREEQDLEDDLKKAQEYIKWCNHLVVIYPTWWGTVPALLKGFIDRVFLPNFAFRSDGKSIPQGLLKGKSARLITTMDAPWIYNLIVRRPGTNMLKRATLKFSGFSPIKATTFYGLRNSTEEKRLVFLEKVKTLGQMLI